MLKSIKVVNGFQHRSLQKSFEPGTTLVLGENGRGKSNALALLEYAVTGVLPVKAKEDLITWGETTGYVEVVLSGIDHKEYKIRREFAKNRQTLTTEGFEYTKAADIAAAMEHVIGMDARAASELLFAKQDAFSGLLTMDHADRARLLGTLLGNGKVTKLREYLQDFRNRIMVFVDKSMQLAEYRKDLATAVTGCSGFLAEIAKREAEAAPMLLNKASWEAIANAPCREDKEKAQAAALAALDKATKELEATDQLLAQMPSPDSSELLDMSHHMLNKKFMEHQAAMAQVQVHRTALEAVTARTIPIPAIPAWTQADDEECRKQAEVLSDAVRKHKLMVDGVCPTCASRIGNPDPALHAAEVAKLAEFIAALRRWLSESDTRKQASNKAWTDHQIATRSRENELARLNKCLADAQLAITTDPLVLNFDKTDFDTRLQKQQVIVDQIAARRRYEQQRQTYADNVANLKAQCTVSLEGSYPAAQIYAARTSLQALESINAEIGKFREREAAARSSVGHIEKAIEAILKEEETRKRSVEVITMFENSKQLLGPNGLIRIATNAIIPMLNEKTDRWMKAFNTQYTMRMNEDMDFMVRFPGAEEKPVSVLSGGQRIVASTCFRLALIETISRGRTGFMALDEPTAFLDTHNKEALAGVLFRASSLFKAAKFTVLIPTNDEILKGGRHDDEWVL